MAVIIQIILLVYAILWTNYWLSLLTIFAMISECVEIELQIIKMKLSWHFHQVSVNRKITWKLKSLQIGLYDITIFLQLKITHVYKYTYLEFFFSDLNGRLKMCEVNIWFLARSEIIGMALCSSFLWLIRTMPSKNMLTDRSDKVRW